MEGTAGTAATAVEITVMAAMVRAAAKALAAAFMWPAVQ
jgi:hypothetical protein